MTKEEFYSQVDVEDGVRIPYFKERRRPNYIAETAGRIRAVGGVLPTIPLYDMHKFLSVNETCIKNFGKIQPMRSDTYNIYRESINRADYAARTGRLR